jgi:hypothetical protein
VSRSAASHACAPVAVAVFRWPRRTRAGLPRRIETADARDPRTVTLTSAAAASSLSGMAPSSPDSARMCRLVVLFAVATLLGHVCGLEPIIITRPTPRYRSAPPAPIPASPWRSRTPLVRASRRHPPGPSCEPSTAHRFPSPGRAVQGLVRAEWASNVPVPRLPLFVLHAALLI